MKAGMASNHAMNEPADCNVAHLLESRQEELLNVWMSEVLS